MFARRKRGKTHLGAWSRGYTLLIRALELAEHYLMSRKVYKMHARGRENHFLDGGLQKLKTRIFLRSESQYILCTQCYDQCYVT